jgi:hypothetical protein
VALDHGGSVVADIAELRVRATQKPAHVSLEFCPLIVTVLCAAVLRWRCLSA